MVFGVLATTEGSECSRRARVNLMREPVSSRVRTTAPKKKRAAV
jgi:hypothetical protein